MFISHKIFLQHGSFRVLKGDKNSESLIDKALKIVQKNKSKHQQLTKKTLRETLLLLAFLNASGIEDNIPNELDESFLCQLVDLYVKHEDDKFPESQCTGHFKYLGEGSSNFDSIKSLKAYWDEKISEQVDLGKFVGLLANLLKMSIVIWKPNADSPGGFWCSQVFEPKFSDFCFVALMPYDLVVNMNDSSSLGCVPLEWSISKDKIVDAENFFCPLEMTLSKFKIKERPNPLDVRSDFIVGNDSYLDERNSITFNYMLYDMVNNAYIHSLDYLPPSQKAGFLS